MASNATVTTSFLATDATQNLDHATLTPARMANAYLHPQMKVISLVIVTKGGKGHSAKTRHVTKWSVKMGVSHDPRLTSTRILPVHAIAKKDSKVKTAKFQLSAKLEIRALTGAACLQME